jgi:hypothetical protein
MTTEPTVAVDETGGDPAVFVLGTDATAQEPILWDTRTDPHLGVYGGSRTGKTNLACQLARQGVAQGWDVRVIEVLKGGAEYAWNRAAWVATDANDAVFILADVDRILASDEPPPKPLLVVVDDASPLSSAARSAGDDMHSLVAAAASVANALATGQEHGVHVVLGAQKRPLQWRTDMSVALGKMSRSEATTNIGYGQDLHQLMTPPGTIGGWLKVGRNVEGIVMPHFAA